MKTWHRDLLAALIVIVLTILAYGESVENEFVHDDHYQIVRNPLLRSDSPWYLLLTKDVWAYTAPGQSGVSNYYRPLQMLSYRWTASVAGFKASAFHRVNLVFHVLASLAAYVLFWQLTRQDFVAFAATVLFVVHPIHSEAVVWIAALPELGCAAFFFVSVTLFVTARKKAQPLSKKERGSKRPSTSSRKLLAWSLASFCVALLWKEMALTLPLVVLAYVFLLEAETAPRETERFRRALISSWPYWAIVVVYLGLRYSVLGFISKEQIGKPLSMFEQAMNILGLTAQYGQKLLWPNPLNAFYLFEPISSLFDPKFLAGLSLTVSVLSLSVVWRRKYPLEVYSVLWVFVTLIPVLHIRGVGMNVFTERYLYIPSVGFCLLMACLLRRSLVLLKSQHRLWAGTLALFLISIPYTAQCMARNKDWKDDLTFYRKTADTSPKAAAVQNFLSNALRERSHNLDEAERCALRAIELGRAEDPVNQREVATGYLNVANVSIQQKRFEAALQASEMGMQSDPTVPGLRVVNGIALFSLGRISEANELLAQISRQSPNDEIVLHLLGVIALSQRRLDTAVEYFTKALAILPGYRDAHNNLAAAYAELGRYQDALVHLQQAVQLSANDPMAHLNLGIIFSRLGRVDEARMEFRRAQALGPNDPAVRAQIDALLGSFAR